MLPNKDNQARRHDPPDAREKGAVRRRLSYVRDRWAREKRSFITNRMVGFVMALSLVLLAFRADLPRPDGGPAWEARDQELIPLNQIEVIEEPKPVEPEPEQPKPEPVKTPEVKPNPQAPPVEVPNEVVVENPAEELDRVSADLDLGENLVVEKPAPPPPPPPPAPEPEVYDVVEQMPELIGGLQGLQDKVDYPDMAKRAGVEGRVIVQFVVDEDGRVQDPRIVRGVGAGLDDEALRAIKQARFVPGVQNGRPVKVKMSVPITFKLR